MRPALLELSVADPPEQWEALGFAIADNAFELEGVTIRLGVAGRGITSWTLTGVPPTQDLDGLATTVVDPCQAPAARSHPNGATALDHVVIVTPEFDRTAAALEAASLPLRRIRDGGAFRQGFRRLGPAIVELVEAHEAPDGPARFWGLVVTVSDLDALAERLGERLGEIHPAVQSGQRIATLRASAGLTPKVAFMAAEPG